jgi:hypothetical protein
MTNDCNKESEIVIENDNIPLKYVDLIPDTKWIDIDNDMIKDIVLLDTTVEYGIPGSVLYLDVKYARSNNERITISWGRDAYPIDEYLLSKDSIINNSLVWEYSFLVWGPGPWMNYGYDPNYIGIRYISNIDTFYGWIYKPDNYLVEYAIDTSTIKNNMNVYAGHKIKY